MAILIREEDVKKFWTIEDSIAATEEAYRQYGLGKAGSNGLKHGYRPPPRCEVHTPETKNFPHSSPEVRAINQSMAYLEETGLFFLRWGLHLGEKQGGMSYLIDADTGDLLALIKASRIPQTLRTASAGAVGAKYLSRKDSRIAGMVGTGRQGKAQLEQLMKVRPIEKAYAHSGRRKDVEYANEMSKKLGIDVIACDNIEEVVKKADILATNTLATEPIIKGEWLSEGVHINAIGADGHLKVEFDFAAVKRFDKLVIDDYELALDTKELWEPLNQGIITMKDIHGTIGDVVTGKVSRENDSEITFFESTGMTMPYVVIYARIYEKVKELGLGEELTTNLL